MADVAVAKGADEHAPDAQEKSCGGVVAVSAVGCDEGQFADALEDVGLGGRSCGVCGVGHGVRGGGVLEVVVALCLVGFDG